MIYGDFLGFTFDNVHSSKFNLYYVSNGSRYSSPFSGSISNNSISVQGYEGEYFFNTNLGKRSFSLNCAVENATEEQVRGMQYWLRPGNSGILVIDGLEYKYSVATLSKAITFSFMPFNGANNDNLYSGTFSISFVAFDPYQYSTFTAANDFTFDEDTEWYWESGVLFEKWSPNVLYNQTTTPGINGVDTLTTDKDFILYNGGNAPSLPEIKITGSWDTLIITNSRNGQFFSLDENDGTYPVYVDCALAQILINGELENSKHSGDFIKILGTGLRTEKNAILTASDIVTLADATDVWDADIVGRFLFFYDEPNNIGYNYSVIALSSDNKEIQINEVYSGTIGTYETVIADANIIEVSGINLDISELSFLYKYVYY